MNARLVPRGRLPESRGGTGVRFPGTSDPHDTRQRSTHGLLQLGREPGVGGHRAWCFYVDRVIVGTEFCGAVADGVRVHHGGRMEPLNMDVPWGFLFMLEI